MSVTTTLTGGDVLAEALLANGVETIFGLPGVQLDGAFDALARRREAIHLYHTRHEQATAYMANGYALATGRTGTCLVVPGPGLLNAAAGLCTAYACSAPVLCVTGQIRSRDIGKGYGRLHEIPQQLEAMASFTKWAARAARPDDVASVVEEAFSQLANGRPAPVAVEIPPDVLEGTAEGPVRIEGATAPPVAPPALEEAVSLLRRAERPLLVAGGGVLRAAAWEELRELAERLGAPVLTTEDGLGTIDADHPLAYGPLCSRRLLAAADVIVAVGTRFSDPEGGRRRLRPEQRLIRIDASREELHRASSPAVAIEADARIALAALAAGLESVPRAGGWRDVERIREEARRLAASVQPLAAYGGEIRRALPDDTVVVAGMTQIGYWSRYGFPVRRPRSYLNSGYQGTLGFEYPTGLGAQVGRQDTRVVVLVGDGGFFFNVQELATAVQHQIPAIVVVFNDGAFGNVKRIQEQRFDGRLIGSELRNPDLLQLAAAFGVRGIRAESPEGLGQALREALDVDGPVLVEVPMPPVPDPWTFTRDF
ncbi:MAG: thiamine pyrophosphate-dependent enzyme [Candidatus Dormiibacterota bacterium]